MKSAAEINAQLAQKMIDFAPWDAWDTEQPVSVRVEGTRILCSQKNAAALAAKIKKAHRTFPTGAYKRVKCERVFPAFEPGMKTIEYIARFAALNARAHLLPLDLDALGDRAAALYENGALDFDAIEERDFSEQAAQDVTQVLADAVAAVAIDTAQTTARADELAQVAHTQADTAVDVVADVKELAEVATLAADVVSTKGCTPGHTNTGHATSTQRSSSSSSSSSAPGATRGQLVAGKSGKWSAVLHTTPAGLPGMVYTGPDGTHTAHEFDTGRERMAALQRLAREADAPQKAGTQATPGATGTDGAGHTEPSSAAHTPPALPAQGTDTPRVCPADAPDYTDPLNTLGLDYTNPLKTLAQPPATPTDWQALVGAGVTYTGDACNAPGNGAIVAVNETPCGRAAWLTVDVMLEDGRHPKALRLNAFGDKPGDRYRLRPMLHGAPYLAQLAAAVAMREANRTATKAIADKAHADATARLAVEFAHLERAENTHGGGTFAARNIRTELKRAFPGVKFSVTSDYNSVRVKWTDGPTDAQVNDVIGRFSTGESDTQSDYFYTVETAFSKLFGGVQYLFTDRNTSEAFTADVLAAWWPTRGESATHPAPCAQDWKRGEGLFSWRTGCDHLRDAFRKHINETAGPAPTPAKATRKAKA